MRINVIPLAAAASVVLAATALAQSPNPACQRLEGQLASLDRGNDDPQRAETVRRAEGEANRLQFEVDKLVAQSRKLGCESSGFFSIFNTPPAQCGPLNSQIAQARNALERQQTQLEQLHGGNTERGAQRRSILIALSDAGCGPQYRQASVQQGGNFLERLFTPGGNSPFFSSPDSSGTYRTICVRTCDGYYFPISFAAPAGQFQTDQATCQRMCPAQQVELYSYRNPGEEVNQAVSVNGGAPYSALPTAFRYRTSVDKACSCRKPGESWADALKTTGADTTIAPGDVVVTDKNAKQLSQAPGTRPPAARPATAAAPTTQTSSGDVAEPPKGQVRSIGPNFYPVR
ncbi:MAG: DUF2865 domain-containing protein [Pseudolabrys sp.]|nr:DUF2865 domain-containing protein [Pseudolabrys sp.]